MIIKYISTGFFIKVAASFDDTLSRAPVLSSLTQTRQGKIAFSIGTLLSLTVALAIAAVFSEIVENIPGVRLIIASLIFLLALAVYFEIFSEPKKLSNEREINKIKKQISSERFFKLIGIGFLISFLTLLDDIVVMTPAFLEKELLEKIFTIAGIYIATIIQVLFVIFFSHIIDKIKHKKELASASLVILSFLIILNII